MRFQTIELSWIYSYSYWNLQSVTSYNETLPEFRKNTFLSPQRQQEFMKYVWWILFMNPYIVSQNNSKRKYSFLKIVYFTRHPKIKCIFPIEEIFLWWHKCMYIYLYFCTNEILLIIESSTISQRKIMIPLFCQVLWKAEKNKI